MGDKNTQIATAGNRGDRVRSDCWVSLEITNSGGIQFNLKSKVKVLFGKAIEKQAYEILDFFGIKNNTYIT